MHTATLRARVLDTSPPQLEAIGTFGTMPPPRLTVVTDGTTGTGMDTAASPLDRHLAWCRAINLRPGTIYQRRRVLTRLGAWLDGRDLIDATRTDLAGWLTSRPILPESRATELSHLRGFYRWAVVEGLVLADPTALMRRPHLPRRLPRPMPTAVLADGLDRAPERVRLALMLAAYAGLRACEIAQLRGEHIDRERGVIVVHEGKGGGMSTVPLHPLLADELDHWPARGPVWPRGDALAGHAAPHLVSAAVNRWLHRQGSLATLHQARHWFGAEAYRATGRDLRVTQELLRHRSPVSTALYTWIDPADGASAVARIAA